MNVREKLLDILELNGIFIDREKNKDDIDLREYISDSIQFISFIVEIEKEMNMEFPNELLFFDKIASLNGFSNILESVILDKYVSPIEITQDYDPLEDDDYDEDDPYSDSFEGDVYES